MKPMAEKPAIGKRGPGRPPVYELPPRIDATPEEIAEVVLRAKPPKAWLYPKRHRGPSR